MSNTETKAPASPVIAWVAFGLALAGLVFAIIPGVSFFAWVVILAAFIVSIVALAKKSKKGLSVVSLILSIVAGVVAIIVSIVTALAVVAGAASAASDSLTASQDEIQAGIGQTVTTSDGLDFTLDSVTCGQPTYEGQFGTETAIGQFCVVGFTLANNGSEPATAFINDFGGLVGETNVEALFNIGVGGFAPDNGASIELNPGLSTTGTAVIDIAAGASLDAVTFGGLRDEIAVAAK